MFFLGCMDAIPSPGKSHVGDEIQIVVTSGMTECQEKCGKHYECEGATHSKVSSNWCVIQVCILFLIFFFNFKIKGVL